MRITRLKINNFRGIKNCELHFGDHVVLVGDHNSGKSTVLEAIDLVLGPERLSRRPVIDEHDFYAGEYKTAEGASVEILIEALVTDLSDEQQRHFYDHLDWWDTKMNSVIDSPPPEKIDDETVIAALRVGFRGYYDIEEDDFGGETYFLSPELEDGKKGFFYTSDKRKCGFLLLRTLRTGSRALSLERGSLLDIILKMQEKRLQMWEDVLSSLRTIPVAEKPELGIKDTLAQIQEKIHSFVPSDWADNPHIKVSDLTREHLRRTLTVFMETGTRKSDGTEYAAPFQHQGTGMINMLVLSLLSMIADLKMNVIFAMEEPEIAIPPHTQKRIVESVRVPTSQAIFTSHSPYILEEFPPSEIVILQRNADDLIGYSCSLPPAVKMKSYKEELRKRFCESLLSRRVLITEGRTEYDSWSSAAKKLNEFEPGKYKTLSNLGIAVLNAETDSQVALLGEYFHKFGKQVFAVFDSQSADNKQKIEASGAISFESPEKGFENLILTHSSEDALQRFVNAIVAAGEWPTHLSKNKPKTTDSIDDIKESLREYFKYKKGSGAIADFIDQCQTCDEIPLFIRKTLQTITEMVYPIIENKECDELLEHE